ncbi:MAG: restriction endonuclease subunit S [Coriobacteriales bacterium]|nr:restriction endonuclease subunit S [Coriobacteriales bacterium]
MPESWEWCRLDDIGTFIRGSGIKRSETKPSGIPCVRYGEIYTTYNFKMVAAVSFVESSLAANSKDVHTGDLLMTLTGETKEEIGKTVAFMGNEQTVIGGDLAAFSHYHQDPMYLSYFMNSPYAIQQKMFLGTGDLIVHISCERLSSILVPLPPFAEQRRIVAAIESAFAVIDEIEQAKTDLKTAVERSKQKILSLAITGKLVPQDPADEPASVLLERIRAEREQLVKAGKIKRGKGEKAAPISVDNSYYENLPAGWAVCRLDEVLDYEQPTQYIVESTAYSDEYETPVLIAGKSFIIGYTNEQAGICSDLPVIIFDDFTTDSRYVDFAFKVKSSAMKILRSGYVDIKYLYYFMQTVECNHTTHKRYWISDFSQKPLALPPIAEQGRIVVAIESAFEMLDEVVENLN